MPDPRSVTPARNGRSLTVRVVLPAALVTALIAAAVAVLGAGAAHRAADKELDARAATVKKAWDAVGRPPGGAPLERLGARLSAQLRVVRGTHPAPTSNTGKLRRYAFVTGDHTTLRVALTTSESSDAVSKGFVAGLIVALAGALLLAAVLSALLRGAATGPLRSMANAIGRLQAGAGDARAPLQGAREVRSAAAAFNQVADRATELERLAGTDILTGLPTGPRVR